MYFESEALDEKSVPKDPMTGYKPFSGGNHELEWHTDGASLILYSGPDAAWPGLYEINC